MEGHLIDSDILRRAMSRIVEEGGEFEVEEFKVGKTNDDAQLRCAWRCRPTTRRRSTASSRASRYLGAATVVRDAMFAPAEADGILPDEFYSTTNFDTIVRIDGTWESVADQSMDCALVLRDGVPTA